MEGPSETAFLPTKASKCLISSKRLILGLVEQTIEKRSHLSWF